MVGKGCFIGHGAIVVGVEIPDGRLVPNGRLVDSADAVDALPRAEHIHQEFNEDVVEVNRGLAKAYRSADRGSEAIDEESAPNRDSAPVGGVARLAEARSIRRWEPRF